LKFIPNSPIKNEMLQEIDLKSVDELFSDIPKQLRVEHLDLQDGLSQQEVEKKLRCIASKNKSCYELKSFRGGGVKPHYVPAAVKSVVSRSEFYSAYTPYQSEASQGFLQAMFEYQSMISDLTGMDVANASLYDAATGLGEAALMCARLKRKRNKFIVPSSISWGKKSVLRNYTCGADLLIEEVGFDDKTGRINLDELEKKLDDDVCGVYLENPNFFGVFEDDAREVGELVKNAGGLFVVGVDFFSLGVVSDPGSYGADIVIGEGRGLGNGMDFGGSSLGVFACKQDFIRRMPGRLIGLTEDEDGNMSFCMTLQTREQHIRRGRATSNICTNQGLCALTACCYLSLLGGKGFEEVSENNFLNGQKLSEMLSELDVFKKRFTGSCFNEMVFEYMGDPVRLNKKLLTKKYQGGLILNDNYPGLKDCMLFGVTECFSDEEIKGFVDLLREVA
jgi:glycine dehydrogenase subunit 1